MGPGEGRQARWKEKTGRNEDCVRNRLLSTDFNQARAAFVFVIRPPTLPSSV